MVAVAYILTKLALDWVSVSWQRVHKGLTEPVRGFFVPNAAVQPFSERLQLLSTFVEAFWHLRRTVPRNYILLFIFTAAESYMLAGLSARYDPITVIAAEAKTALVTFVLTVYAITTKVAIQVFAAIN